MHPPLKVPWQTSGFDYNSAVDGALESHARDPYTVNISKVASKEQGIFGENKVIQVINVWFD